MKSATAIPEIKIVAAKEAASGAVRRALGNGTVEVAILAFEGDCARPVPRYADFTTDFGVQNRFIASLQPGGGTPMAPALLYANRFMSNEGADTARDQMIVLLADGQNDCGSVSAALAELKASGVIFRHETIGFGIEPTSSAASDLRDIATQSGGTYHHAANSTQLGDLLEDFVDTFSVIDLLGTFGGGSTNPSASSRPATPGAPANPSASSQVATSGGTRPSATPSPSAGGLSDLLGQFGRNDGAAASAVDEPATPGAALCYRRFVNPSGLETVRDQHSVTEFTCAPSCPSLDVSAYSTVETEVRDPPGMSCPEQCAFAVGTDLRARFVQGRSISENYCVGVLDPLQPPVDVTHYYCDYKDNKHRVVWRETSRPTGDYLVYLNHFPARNDEAELLGETRGNRFDFEYGINFHANPVVDGLNLWNPFPRAGVSACNKYGICTPVVYGEVVDEDDCGP